MARYRVLMFISLSIFASLFLTPVYPSRSLYDASTREGWAAILEMNDYPGEYNDLTTNYNDTRKWRATLQVYGWQSNHIHVINGELTSTIGIEALNFLINNADENDVVFFFIFAHGNWIKNEMDWFNWFPTLWSMVPSHNKLLVVSSCKAGTFVNSVIDDSISHVHIGSVQADEYAWAGLPEEGLPIIGEVFNHYFTAAFLNTSADLDSNGEVTVEEAFALASPQSRNYLTNIVFSAYPYYAEMCNNSAPYPRIDDSYSGELSLLVEPGDPPDNLLSPLFWMLIPLLIAGVAVALILSTVLLLWRRRST